MARYRRKPVEIEAIKWTGNNKDDIFEFGGDGIHIYNNCLFVDTFSGQVICNNGHYIVKYDNGKLSTCTPDVLSADYELIG